MIWMRQPAEMEFFVPPASGPEEAESVLAAVAAFVGATVPPPDRRIRKLVFAHNGQRFTVEVGKPIPPYYREGDQEVVCILGSDPLMVCLPTRGVLRGDPILVGASTVHRVDYFSAGSTPTPPKAD